MTTTYSTDEDMNARLELPPEEFSNMSKEDKLDRWRVAAWRKIQLEYQRVAGSAAPTPADVAAADDADPVKVLIEAEADFAAALFRENRLELTEDARPERDKSWVWKKRAIRDYLLPLIRTTHSSSRVKATRDPAG